MVTLSGLPNRFTTFFMNLIAAALSRSFVTKLSSTHPRGRPRTRVPHLAVHLNVRQRRQAITSGEELK